MSEVIVTLLDHSSRNEENVATAGRTCYSKRVPADIYGGFILDERGSDKQIGLLRDSGHFSTFEHTFYMFSVEGISRAATHQLVRHRHLSFEQQSQRYTQISTNDKWYVTPPDLTDLQRENFITAMNCAAMSYDLLIINGAKPEDARAVLPNAAKTTIIVSGNARAFYEFFTLRTCENAQYEIRHMAYEMLRQVKKLNPSLFKNSGATCVRGYCNERNGPDCKRYCAVKKPHEKTP